MIGLMAIPGKEGELPTHITDAGYKLIAVGIVDLSRSITTALVVIMHQTAAMMVCPMAAIKVLPVQLPSGVVVFGPADMAAGAILHFVQTHENLFGLQRAENVVLRNGSRGVGVLHLNSYGYRCFKDRHLKSLQG